MKGNRLTAGIGLVVLGVLIVVGAILLLREAQNGQAQVAQREPIPGLGYCDAARVRPCVVSFSLDREGQMIVNILTSGAPSPDFYLKIRHTEGESIYPCQRATSGSTGVYCTGRALPLGQEFQFFIHAVDDNRLLAQGDFSIIGLALATVNIYISPTAGTPVSPTPSPTASLAVTTPAPTSGTPTRTPTVTRTPSYPNPSLPTRTRTPAYP